MANENNVTLVGTLTRDPELRFTTGGRGVASAGIAVNKRFMSNNEWKEETSFFNLTIWGELGENVAASCFKGTRVIATGELKQREYETREGEKRNVTEVVVSGIGPELRFATAEVAKIQRDKPQNSGTPDKAADPVYGDEEPF